MNAGAESTHSPILYDLMLRSTGFAIERIEGGHLKRAIHGTDSTNVHTGEKTETRRLGAHAVIECASAPGVLQIGVAL
jgi:hypothetical protein